MGVGDALTTAISSCPPAGPNGDLRNASGAVGIRTTRSRPPCSGEVRRAAWTEIDRDEAVWTIPARRTKGNCTRRKNRAIDLRAVQDRPVERFAGVRPAGLNPC